MIAQHLENWASGDQETKSDLQPIVQQQEAACPEPGTMRFRRFVLSPGRRQLLRNGTPVELGSRAFDLLMILLRSRGALVTKEEIIKHVWPSTVVDDSNLRFQMASLRKALGDDRDIIKTIPGRGYLLAEEVETELSRSEQFNYGPQVITSPSRRLPSPSSVDPQSVNDTACFEPLERPQVIVIDDDKDTREAIEGLLRSAGLCVQVFASVQAFLSNASPRRAGCIVLDVWMPGRGGLDLQAELSKSGVRIPIIFISGHADVHTSVRAMKAGAIEFLTKPVRHQDLLDAIESALSYAEAP